MRARLHHLVLDCPDPHTLAAFYSRLLGDPVTYGQQLHLDVMVEDVEAARPWVLGLAPPTSLTTCTPTPPVTPTT